jgi:hypothetical protein
MDTTSSLIEHLSDNEVIIFLQQRLIPFSFGYEFIPLMTTLSVNYMSVLNAAASTALIKDRIKIIQNIAKEVGIEHFSRRSEGYLFIEACVILIMSREPSSDEYLSNMEDFLLTYQDFKELSIVEIESLLRFHNMMLLAIRTIYPKQNKSHLLEIVTRLTEGKDVHYVTGGGERLETRNRVLIYERVGGLRKRQRPPRINEMIRQLFRNPSNIELTSASATSSPLKSPVMTEEFKECLRSELFKDEHLEEKEFSFAGKFIAKIHHAGEPVREALWKPGACIRIDTLAIERRL